MPLIVEAKIIDIRRDKPYPQDVFLVDTNVWYFQFYSRVLSVARNYQVVEYTRYLGKLLGLSTLCYSGLSLVELSHIIERQEHDFYEQANGEIPMKEYRQLAIERTKVLTEISDVWKDIQIWGNFIDVLIDKPLTDAAFADLQSLPLDGYDVILLEAMHKEGITQIITDDSDFASVPDIQVFTANERVITEARQQGKLLNRK
jgi:predicted nucleic acid-binding protein